MLYRVVMDFRAGMWRGFSSEYPDVELQGCSFHWRRSVLRKVQELGLITDYNRGDHVHTYIQQLLALPMLPPEDIPQQFQRLSPMASTQALRSLCEYIEDKWLGDGLWRPEAWSVFCRSMRINNDVEGKCKNVK